MENSRTYRLYFMTIQNTEPGAALDARGLPILKMNTGLSALLLFLHWGLFQDSATLPPCSVRPPLVVSCWDLQHHGLRVHKERQNFSCQWDMDIKLLYLRTSRSASKTGKQPAGLRSPYRHRQGSTSIVRRLVLCVIAEWPTAQLGWCMFLHSPPWHHRHSSRHGEPLVLLPTRCRLGSPTPYYPCPSSFGCCLMVHNALHSLCISSLHVQQRPLGSLHLGLQVEPVLLHVLSTHSEWFSISGGIISLSWNVSPASSEKVAYRRLDVMGRGAWSTSCNPFLLQNNFSISCTSRPTGNSMVAGVHFRTSRLGSGELGYSNATLSLLSKRELPTYFILSTKKIFRSGIRLFSCAQGLYYSVQKENTGNLSSIHSIFYQQEALSYLILLEFDQRQKYRLSMHLYLNRKGVQLRSFSENNIEIHIFNSGPSLLQSFAYIVWFIPLQHPLLQAEWIFNLQFFDSQQGDLLRNDTYHYGDHVGHAARFLPRVVLLFNPALYAGFVTQLLCTKSGHTQAILKAAVNTYTLKVTETTVACIEKRCFLWKVKIHKSDPADYILNYTKSSSFVLSADTQVNCPAPHLRDMVWKIYKVPDVKTTPDWSKPFDIPIIRRRNITLEVPGFSLDVGLYLFNFTLKLSTVDTLESVERSDSVFVAIGPGKLIAAIAGGDLKTVAFSDQWTLDGSASFDSEAAQSFEGLTYSWYCSKEKHDYLSKILSRGGKCHSEQTDLKWTTSSDPIQVVPPRTLQENTTYYFRLEVRKGSRASQVEQIVQVWPDSALLLNITCIENCGRSVISTTRFCLSGKCLNCRKSSRPHYYWSLFSANFTEIHFDWDSKTTTGRSSSYLCINSRSFVNVAEDSYLLTLKVSTQVDEPSVHNYSFFVNLPPVAGKCVLHPSIGIAFLTKFIVHCDGFQDKNLPLTYKVRATSDSYRFVQMPSLEQSSLGTIVYFGYQSKIPPTFLPVGAPSKQYALTVHVEIYDALGAFSQINLQAMVHGPSASKEDHSILNQLHDLTRTPTAPISSLLEREDYFRAGYFIYIVTSILNNIKALHSVHSSKTELREMLLSKSAEIPTTDLTVASQMISSISQITEEATEMNRKSQLFAIRKLKKVGEVIKEFNAKDLGSKEIKVLCAGILVGLSNVLKASLLDLRNIHIDGVKEAISAAEILAYLVLRDKVPGENETIMEANNWTVTLRKEEKWDFSGGLSTRTYYRNCFYPKMKEGAMDELPEDAMVATVIYEFEKNPFPWLPGSDDIGTMVTGFKMTGTGSNADPVEIVPETVEMILTKKLEVGDVFELRMEYDKEISQLVGGFSFQVHQNSRDIFIQIVSKMELMFQVFVYIGLQVNDPPIASFTLSHSMPAVPNGNNSRDNNCTLQTPYIFCLSKATFKSMFKGSKTQRMNVSIVLQSDSSISDPTVSKVGIVLFSASCLHMNGIQSHWKGGLCSLGPQTNWQKLHCVCNAKKRVPRTISFQQNPTDDIKFLAGKITLPPTPVKMERSQLPQTYKNPLMMLTVLCIFLIYIILAVWTIRKDKADMERRSHVVVLPDNDPFDKVCYLVTIFTGSRLGAGTTANVFVQLVGHSAVSDIHCLRHPQHQTFLRGGIDTFLLTSKNDLGDIYCLRLWHNNAGSSPNWFLSRIKVENIYTKQSWIFMCRKWFSLYKGDGLIERSFIVAQPAVPLKKPDFFLITFAHNLAYNHLWFSIFGRVCTGSLNRLQRLSCCLAILLCLLLINIVLFNVDRNQQMLSQHLQYLRSIIIGIQSSFISIPLQLIIIALFKYSQKQPLAQNTLQHPSQPCSVSTSGNLRNWKNHLQKWYLTEISSKGPESNVPKVFSSASDSCQLGQMKRRQMTRKWSNCAVSEGDANIIAADEDKPNNNFSNNFFEKDEYPPKKPLNVANMLFCRQPQILFSKWNRYASWILAFAISTVSSFFIIFYGLTYDYTTSLEWLSACTVSFFMTVFLLQTLNIIFFSALEMLYPKHHDSILWSSPEAYLEIRLDDVTMDADDMRELHYDLVRMRGSKLYQPLEEDEITIFKKRQKIQCQAFVFMKDIICHFVFLILILNIAYSMENTTSFYNNQAVSNKISLALSEVNKVDHIYFWLRSVFLPLIHNRDQPSYLSETWFKILGLPRMRQIRAKNTTKECFYPHSFVNKFVISKSHCLHKYGHDQEDQKDYLGSWTHPTNKSISNNSNSFSGFTYQSAIDPWGYSSYGTLNTYEAGGYPLYFYPEKEQPNSIKRIHNLERNNWLDENTWALIVEMTVFNTDVDLFCSVSVVFEISHLGPINTSLLIHSYKLPIFKQLSSMEKLVYVAVGYILVFYIIDELSVVEHQRMKYIKKVSNLINFGIKGVCLFFLLQLAFKFKLGSSLMELYLVHPLEFIPFHKVSDVDKTLRITLSFLVFLIVLKTLRYSRFFYDVRLAQRSILAALPGICSMALVVAVYFFVYMAFGYLVFGQNEWNYNTMTHSAQTVFSYCVSAFKDTAFTSNRVLGGLFLASFMMVMICVLINLFQAVIMSAYEDMKQPVYEEPSDEAEVVNFLFHKFQSLWFFITFRRVCAADTELFNRVLFGHSEKKHAPHLGLKTRRINGKKMVYLVI